MEELIRLQEEAKKQLNQVFIMRKKAGLEQLCLPITEESVCILHPVDIYDCMLLKAPACWPFEEIYNEEFIQASNAYFITNKNFKSFNSYEEALEASASLKNPDDFYDRLTERLSCRQHAYLSCVIKATEDTHLFDIKIEICMPESPVNQCFTMDVVELIDVDPNDFSLQDILCGDNNISLDGNTRYKESHPAPFSSMCSMN